MIRQKAGRKVKCIRCGRMVDLFKTSQKGYCFECIGEMMVEAGREGGKRRRGNLIVKKAFNEYAGKSN